MTTAWAIAACLSLALNALMLRALWHYYAKYRQAWALLRQEGALAMESYREWVKLEQQNHQLRHVLRADVYQPVAIVTITEHGMVPSKN